MNDLREAARLALDALEVVAKVEHPAHKVMTRKKPSEAIVTIYPHKVAADAIIALRAALEQPAQDEPVDLEAIYETIIRWDIGGGKRSRRELARRIVALYTRPQAREPLTEGAILQFAIEADDLGTGHIGFARAIEAAHGITGEKK